MAGSPINWPGSQPWQCPMHCHRYKPCELWDYQPQAIATCQRRSNLGSQSQAPLASTIRHDWIWCWTRKIRPPAMHMWHNRRYDCVAYALDLRMPLSEHLKWPQYRPFIYCMDSQLELLLEICLNLCKLRLTNFRIWLSWLMPSFWPSQWCLMQSL